MERETTVNIEVLVSRMNNQLQEILKGGNKSHQTIHRIPPHIREEYPQDYDPRIISIGPFHCRQDKEVVQPMQQLKWRFLKDLIDRSPSNSLDKYIEEVASLETKARECYSGELLEHNGGAFVETMVLDGCFIIEFLFKLYLGPEADQLFSVNWNLPLLRNDLLLLENQIPFFVLQSLFDNSTVCYPNDFGRPTLTDIALGYLTKKYIYEPACQGPREVHHLLHLYHWTLIPTPQSSPQRSNHHGYSALKMIIKACARTFFYGVIYLIFYREYPHSLRKECLRKRAPRSIPSATELRLFGVHFKRKERARSILDVTFTDGTLEMPPLLINSANIPLFRNLVVFEQCSPKSGSHFTSYLALIDNLIDTPDEIAVLMECGIVESMINGKGKWEASFINSLGKGCYLDYEDHIFRCLFFEVNEYCETHSSQWRARLLHDYLGREKDHFRNPWTAISLVAAVVLLVLTAVQSPDLICCPLLLQSTWENHLNCDGIGPCALL